MKKFLLIISIIFSLLFSGANIQLTSAEEAKNNEVTDCGKIENEIIRITNKYGVFVGNGFVYKVNDEDAYIITSDKLTLSDEGNKIIYYNEVSNDAFVIGKDSYNGVMVLKAMKADNVKGVCLSDSYFFMPGQKNILKGYKDNENRYVEKTFFNKQGILQYKKDYINIYKSIIQAKYQNFKEGMAVVDELDRLVGMVSGDIDKLNENSFIIEVNKLTKIADSIVKSRNYSVNYIKYVLEDYNKLDEYYLKNYKVSKEVSFGVVIVTFKPLSYIFGGLNQGMVIQEVNSIVVKNMYELDNQLSRYKKGDIVCLKVIKKNGKIGYYYTKV